MPHRTQRSYYDSLGLVREQFNRGNDEPCQQCRLPFLDHAAGYRLKTTDGRGVRGYRRVCYGCCIEHLDSLTTFHYQSLQRVSSDQAKRDTLDAFYSTEQEAIQDGDRSE